MSGFSRIRVAVLRGGPSPAYEDSLETGFYVLSLLREMPEVYDPLDIFISRKGEWHHAGLVRNPHEALQGVHVVWNALHGPYGEDGVVQRLLESLQMPFTGSGITASAFATNKDVAKKLYQKHSLLTPTSLILTEEDLTDEKLIKIFRTYLHPVIVKPTTGVRALGVRIAHSFEELKEAIKKTFQHSPKVMVEEYVKGRISSCLVIENVKGQKLYALLPSGRHQPEVNKQIEQMAKTAHEALGQRHYSSSDFIITPRGRVYILETNSLPVFHEGTPTHHSLLATGWRPRDFVDHNLKLALNLV